ncbi:MAG: hypothetical protein K0R62_8419, partial [Nonomuraea muscovyensis]|nr:hypothetical protein [Nonomuraea muscovyensis]
EVAVGGAGQQRGHGDAVLADLDTAVYSFPVRTSC